MDINDEDTKSSSSLKLKRLNKEGWIPFAKLTSLMDSLFVFTVAMFIAAPFAAPYPTLVAESPVQEFMGFTGSHPFLPMDSLSRVSRVGQADRRIYIRFCNPCK